MIQQKTIEKTTAFLNDIISTVAPFGTIKGVEIHTCQKKHKISGDTIFWAIKTNLFKKVINGYSPLMTHYDPLHARKLLEARNSYYNGLNSLRPKVSKKQKREKAAKEYLEKNKLEHKKLKRAYNVSVSEGIRTEIKAPASGAPVKQPRPNKKKFSLLWGLIKWER